MVMQRILGVFAPGFSNSKTSVKRLSFGEMQQILCETLSDCNNMKAERLVYKINAALTPSDLWLLRSDLHQCIAQTHSQREAAERINALIPAFDGWLPASQLTRI
jgi:hypothetical protein